MPDNKSRWRIVETPCPYTNDIEEYGKGHVCREARISDARLIRAAPELFSFAVELRDILLKDKENNEELLNNVNYVLDTIQDNVRDEELYLQEGINFFSEHMDLARE